VNVTDEVRQAYKATGRIDQGKPGRLGYTAAKPAQARLQGDQGAPPSNDPPEA
jgi:hypothetical protein